MKLNIGVAARSRLFSRAISKLRPVLKSLQDEVANITFIHPIYEALLIGITDEKEQSYLVEIPNQDGFYQVLVGMGPGELFAALRMEDALNLLYNQVRRGILSCPFSDSDRRIIEELLKKWASETLH